MQEDILNYKLDFYIQRLIRRLEDGKEKTEKKRHHYLPQFYLKLFTNEHSDRIYQFEKGSHKIIQTTPLNIAVNTNYHTFKTAQGFTDSVSIEDFFSDIEYDAKPVIDKIVSGLSLNEEERAIMAIFIGYTLTRVPNFRKCISDAISAQIKHFTRFMAKDKDKYRDLIQQAIDGTPDKNWGDIDIDSMREFALSDRYRITATPQATLAFSLSLAVDMINIIFQMQWQLLHACNNQTFLTSDNPVFYWNTNNTGLQKHGEGILYTDAELSFPVSSKVALVANWFKPNNYSHSECSKSELKLINKNTVRSAERFVYYHFKDKSIANLVQKYVDSSPRLIVSTMPGPNGSEYSIIKREI